VVVGRNVKAGDVFLAATLLFVVRQCLWTIDLARSAEECDFAVPEGRCNPEVGLLAEEIKLSNLLLQINL